MAGAYDPPNEIPAQDTPELETLLKTETPRLSRLNRSRHWRYAETYKQARTMSPTPWTPVR